MAQSVVEMAKELVMAQIEAHRVPPEAMQHALQKTYASLMALKQQEETGGSGPVAAPLAVPQPVEWKQSIRRHRVTCLECGKTFKQLSGRHLKDHRLDARSYRAKYGIPRTQPLAAKESTALRKAIVQQVRPWEKAPTYVQAHAGESDGKATGTTRQATRRNASTKNASDR